MTRNFHTIVKPVESSIGTEEPVLVYDAPEYKRKSKFSKLNAFKNLKKQLKLGTTC